MPNGPIEGFDSKEVTKGFKAPSIKTFKSGASIQQYTLNNVESVFTAANKAGAVIKDENGSYFIDLNILQQAVDNKAISNEAFTLLQSIDGKEVKNNTIIATENKDNKISVAELYTAGETAESDLPTKLDQLANNSSYMVKDQKQQQAKLKNCLAINDPTNDNLENYDFKLIKPKTKDPVNQAGSNNLQTKGQVNQGGSDNLQTKDQVNQVKSNKVKSNQNNQNLASENLVELNKQEIINWNKINPPQKNYVIVDKKKCSAMVYSPDGMLLKTFEVGLGKEVGDNFNDGFAVLGKTHKTTPPGEYNISVEKIEPHEYGDFVFSIGTKGNLSSKEKDVLMLHPIPKSLIKERQHLFNDEDISNNRMSYGCVNFLDKDFKELAKYIKHDSTVYILPEEAGNSLIREEISPGKFEFVQKKYKH